MNDIAERMSEHRKDRLKKLAQTKSFEFVNLTAEQGNKLLKSILALPVDRQNLIIFKHCYNHTFDELEDLLDIDNAKGEYINILMMLSESLDIKDALISEHSMSEACQKAAQIINERTVDDFDSFIAENSDEFTKKNRSQVFVSSYSLGKKAACIALIGFGVLAGVNAYANGKIFNWVASTFEKHSEFTISEENITDKDTVDIKIGYIPKGFELKNNTISKSADYYYYENEDRILLITFLYDTVKTGLNTENAKIEKFELDGGEATTWKKDNISYFVLSKEGVGCQILGNIDKDEFMKIYEGISVNRK